MTVYRVLSFIVNMFCAFLLLITIFLLLFALSNPALLFQCFLMAGVVLYGWFSNRFFVFVVMGKQKMTRRQKDWLQVNAIVAFIFTIMSIIGIAIAILDPQLIEEGLKQLPMTNGYSAHQFTVLAWVFLSIYIVLFVHIVWTYLLVRKYRAYFEEKL